MRARKSINESKKLKMAAVVDAEVIMSAGNEHLEEQEIRYWSETSRVKIAKARWGVRDTCGVT